MNGSWSVKEWITKRLKIKSKTDGIILILIGIVILIVLVPTGENTKKKNANETAGCGKSSTDESISESQVQTDTEYVRMLEDQVQELIGSMDGAGKVRVMLTLSDDGLTHLDKDVKTQEKTREETTVIYDLGDTKQPYVIQKERPRVEGIVVVAQGGDSPGVIAEITDAMQSLFDLEAHKVKVVKMSVQEE